MRQLGIPQCIECNIDIEENSLGLCDDCYAQMYCEGCGTEIEDDGCPSCMSGAYDGQ